MSLATWVSGEERVALIGMVPSDELRRLAGDLAARSSDHSGAQGVIPAITRGRPHCTRS